MADNKIVKNKSPGFGYKYSNLADLAREGIHIPKMRVMAHESGAEFIQWYDEKLNEWITGARIVAFESKGMNAAQAYGAALTYARRYTVQMAEAIACDDDDAVEKAKPTAKTNNANSSSAPTDKQLGFLAKLLKDAGKTDEEIERIKRMCKTASMASVWIEKAKSLNQQPEEVLPEDDEVA